MSKEKGDDNVYETEESLHMYLGLHYPSSGTKEGVTPILAHKDAPMHGLRFPQRVAQLLVNLQTKRTNNRALDIGCAVGGSSFELAKSFDHVDAFDYSESFVNAAKAMQKQQLVRFKIPVEADIHEQVTAVHEEGVTADVLKRVNFFTGDACRLQTMAEEGKIRMYDGVLMSNLLCRLPDPEACLRGLSQIVNKGGVVAMVTPFSWLEEFTPRSNWLGGYYDNVSGAPHWSKDQLQTIMQECGFQKIHEEQISLVIREHQRKYQYIVSEATEWRKE